MAVSVTIENVVKVFGAYTALKEVSLEVRPGELFFLLGPSGCGKTTLLRCIAGFYRPESGRILIGDEDVTALPPYRRDTGMMFQSYALWPHMTVAQNILFGLRGWPKPKKLSRLRELLDQTGLRDLAGRYPDQISGGEARRAALARSLAHYPRFLLMDEPLTNLDEELKFRLLAYIKETVKQNRTCLVYVTHDPAEAEQICDRVLVIERGSLPKAP